MTNRVTNEQRQQLVQLLLELPNINDVTQREHLLDYLPFELRDNIAFSNAPGTHIRHIVNAVMDESWDTLLDGRRPVLIVIDNAIELARGGWVADQLQELHDSIERQSRYATSYDSYPSTGSPIIDLNRNRPPATGPRTTALDSGSETLYCVNHPTTPTTLRCSRCEKPICLRCAVRTPVGYRCFDCAQIAVMPTYAVSSSSYTRAALVGFGLATLIGIVWAFFPTFDFWAALIMGLMVSEVVSQAANLKRGPGLQFIGVAAVAWGILVSKLLLAVLLTLPATLRFLVQFPGANVQMLFRAAQQDDLLSRTAALFLANDLVGWLFLAMALAMAVIRLR